MKILIATPDFPLWDGGIATVAYEVAKGLHNLGHKVDVMAPRQSEGDIDFDSTLPFRVHRIKNIKSHYLKMYYHIFKMDRLVKRYGYDMVMAQSWYPSGIAASHIAGKYKINTTVTVHGNEILDLRYSSSFWQKRMKKVFETAKIIFCVSEFTSQKLAGRTWSSPEISRKARVIYNGVDFNYFTPSEPDTELIERYKLQGAKIILTLARLVERKGHDMVINALPMIKKSIPQAKYVICGKGKYEENLKQLAEKLGLADDVIFAGFVPNESRNKYYNMCGLYVMPSREILEKGDIEGFGITYLEANACGKPVIGSNKGGASEAIIDGETGFLVDASDSNDIAQKCIALLSDDPLSKKIGMNGRKRIIEEFNWDYICRRIERYCNEPNNK
ncbi:MAG: glycosyltransferase family 4 protein [Nitrospirae bacterium]|nr:glycosyltransferase family 4 protein [Nitrospirota bacterium]